MRVNIGRMNRRITIQYQAGLDEDEEANTEPRWEEFATVWAAISPLRGREYFAAAAVNAETTVRFRIRYRSGVSPAMRVLYNGKKYDIKSVIDVDEGRRQMELMCVEVQAGE